MFGMQNQWWLVPRAWPIGYRHPLFVGGFVLDSRLSTLALDSSFRMMDILTLIGV